LINLIALNSGKGEIMLLRIEDINEEGLSFEMDEENLLSLQKYLATKIQEMRLDYSKKPDVRLVFSRNLDRIYMDGEISFHLTAQCCRCLESFPYEIQDSIRAVLIPKLEEPEEVELKREDLDFEFYEGSCLDVIQLLTEQILLLLPFRFLCKEDCLGLCQICGTNLNKTLCSCRKEKIDERFSKLHLLKLKD